MSLHPVTVFVFQLFTTFRQSLALIIEGVLLPLQHSTFTGKFFIHGLMKTGTFVFEILAGLVDEVLLLFLFGLPLTDFVLTLFQFSSHFSLSAAIPRHLFGKLTRTLFKGRTVGAQLAALCSEFSLTTLQFAETLLQRLSGGTGLQQYLQCILIRIRRLRSLR
jgi:hypothetical protein